MDRWKQELSPEETWRFYDPSSTQGTPRGDVEGLADLIARKVAKALEGKPPIKGAESPMPTVAGSTVFTNTVGTNLVFGDLTTLWAWGGVNVPVVTYPFTAFDVSSDELDALQERLRTLEELVVKLGQGRAEERVIVLRTLSQDEAKGEILKLFKEGGIHDYGEIAETLRLDLPLVVNICNELEQEGMIGGPA